MKQWPGMGPRRVRNNAIRTIENAMAWLAQLQRNHEEDSQALTQLREYLRQLREMSTEEEKE